MKTVIAVILFLGLGFASWQTPIVDSNQIQTGPAQATVQVSLLDERSWG